MDLEGIMLSEISQPEKDKYCVTSLYMEFKKARLTESESSMVVPRGWEVGDADQRE